MEEKKLFGKNKLDVNQYKATTILDILEGSTKTKQDVMRALEQIDADGE